MRKIISVFLTLLLILLPLNKLEAKAASIYENTAIPLELNGQTISGEIETQGSSDVYKITATQAGEVELLVTSYADSLNTYIYSSEDEAIYSGQTGVYPGIKDIKVNLEPGTYYLKIGDENSKVGSFSITPSFVPANNNDVEPNNTIGTAQTMLLDGKTNTGFLSETDNTDFYKITVAKAGKLNLSILTYINRIYFDIYLNDGTTSIYNYILDKTNPTGPEGTLVSLDLEPGTYYLRVRGDKGNTGIYQATSTFEAANNTDNEPNNTVEQAQVLNLDGKINTGFLSQTDNIDYYKFTLTKSGRVSLKTTSNIGSVNEDVYLSDGKTSIYHYSFSSLNNANTEVKNSTIDLDPGTYYLRISGDENVTGKYQIVPTFTAANNIDIEDNSSFAKANLIAIDGNEKIGLFSINDKDDYFKVQIATSGILTIYTNNVQVPYINTKLYDSTGKEIKYTQSGTNILGFDVKAGTYYIRFNNVYSANSGIYKFKLGFIGRVLSVNPINNKSNVVTGYADPYNTIQISINGKMYSSIADANGYYKVAIPVTNGGTSMKVYSYDSNKFLCYTKSIMVTFVAPDIPVVNSVNNKSALIVGKTEANINVYAQIGTSIFSAKSDANGNYSIKIPVLNAGTVINITAKNVKGTSLARTITVESVAPNKPIVNAVNNKSTVVTGKTEANIYVYAQIGNSVYNSKSDANGNYSIKIPVLNSGTIINVTAKNTKGTSAVTAVSVSSIAPNRPIVNAVNNKSTVITGKTEASIYVYIQIGTKVYSAKSDASGNYKIVIPMQKIGTVINVTAKNAKGTSAISAIIVAPDRPTVNVIYNISTVVTGKTEANAYVYAQVGSNIYSTKSNAYGNYSINIPVLNSGTVVNVTVKTSTGIVSAQTTVKVAYKVPNKPLVNQVNNKSTVVTGKTEANIYVYVKIGTLTYSAKSDTSGNYSIKIPVLNSGTIINVTAKNTKGTSAITAVSVVKVAPNKPVVATVHTTSTAITGTAEVGTTVYAKTGTKVYAAKVNTKGQFAIAIPKQLVNTKILVSAKDSLNRESFVQTIIVVK